MRKFNFDDEEADDEEDMKNNPEYELFINQQSIQNMQVEHAERDLNQLLLGIALQLAERSFFWQFKSPENKLRILKKTFKSMKKIANPDLEF